jgi:hypothetical protein
MSHNSTFDYNNCNDNSGDGNDANEKWKVFIFRKKRLYLKFLLK